MATLFQSFRSSTMPKRLLRYALSRLELLDAEALDMDNLDLAIGRNTVFEFRDVGIKLQKLQRLLKLPSTFELQRAKVLLLRVTIPMDFYTSPITVEVEGVDVRLKVGSREEKEATSRNRGKAAAREEPEVVPTPADLAQSFLETQPSAEKKKLEDALAAETQDLGASLSISEDEADDETPFGTGQALSLPAFLTDFLQGIVDRTQVAIRAVTFQLDIDVPVDANSATSDLVTLQLALDGVDVEGVTTPAQEEDGTPKIIHKEGKRHISLENLKAFLISEANVFSTLARSPSMPSSAASQSPIFAGRRPFSREPSDLVGRLDHSVVSDPEELSQGPYPLQDSEDAFNIPYDFGNAGEDNDEDEGGSPGSTPRASIYNDSPRALEPNPNPEMTEPASPRWGSHPRDVHLGSPVQRPGSPIPDLDSSHFEDSFHSSSGGGDAGRYGVEDLTQSHLYTHEEAESMYMSAFSQTESVRIRNTMPGAWDSSPETSPRGPRALRSQVVEREREQMPIKIEETMPETGVQEEEQPPNNEEIVQEVQMELEKAPEAASVEEVDAQGEGDELQQDDVATPRGPTRLIKEILSLGSISVYVPSNHKHLQVSAPELAKSISPNLPGAFSVHSARPTSPGLAPTISDVPEPEPDRAVEIILGSMEVRFDASIGFLLAMVVSKLLESVKGQDEDATVRETGAPASKSGSTLPDIKFTAEKTSLLFLEKLSGVADTPERIFATDQVDFGPETLLRADMINLKAAVTRTGDSTDTNITLDKFRFGYSNADIVSFNRRYQMRDSIMDEFPSDGADISIHIASSPALTRAEVKTLPLHIKLDLQRLDETFSWFGGLSSFLLMSSSMTSNASRTAKSPVQPAQKTRGVRFETTVSTEKPLSASESKVYMRVGGLRLDLLGKECSVALDTSAVKLASNDDLTGIHLSRIRLAGPYLRNSLAPPPIVVEVEDTRLDYLMLPKDKDLERLLELITPSKVKFDGNDDEIMVDTLLRQRRKGPVLRVKVEKVNTAVGNLAALGCLPTLGEELARLSTVAKYLPEDDRPGLLTIGSVGTFDVSVDVGGRVGVTKASLRNLELAHITIPSLVALRVESITANRNKIEELIGTRTTSVPGVTKPPALMMRLIGDDIEPIVKIKLTGLNIEYRVPTVMDILGLAEDATPQDFEASLAASVANLGEQAHTAITGRQTQAETDISKSKSNTGKPTTVDLGFQDCLLGLNPLGLTSKLFVVLTDAHLQVVLPNDANVKAVGHLNRSSILLIDDVSLMTSKEGPSTPRRRPSDASSQQVMELCSLGFVNICQISSAKATVKVTSNADGDKHIDVEVRDDLLVLETCADSTQTLITLANALKPPTPPSKEIKYRTEVVPVEDLLSSLSADAFGKAEGDYDFDDDFAIAQELGGDNEEEVYLEDDSDQLNVDSKYYEDPQVEEALFDATYSSAMSDHTTAQDTNDGVLLTSFSTRDLSQDDEPLVIQENYFGTGSIMEGTAHRWNSAKNTYDRSNDGRVHNSPLRVCVRDVHVIWNLFDGYDWNRTREVIAKAVQEVETKAYERRARTERRVGFDQDFDEEETVIGDFLFNSIYIGIPANRDPRELAQAINQELNDNATETETQSVATTSLTATPSRVGGGGHHRSRSSKKLRLNRSRHHKITFELKGVNVDLVTFPPGSGETQSSIDVRIKDLDIFDHVPTSTWKKFAMYDQDAGEREMGTSMVHLELLNVQPLPELAASEIVLKATVLPLRLHVDQDALDFITRFFEFKDDSVPVHASPSDVPFIQRAEVNSVPVKLDFKPKRVDYGGLRSGHTTEFMNFLILEDARMVLRHTIIYGVTGFDRLGQTLNDIWMPDIKRTQLPGILAGLAPVRSLVNVGSGFRNLVEIPVREYRRDGRIVRSIGKGAAAFARTTGTELVKLGAKLAVGTQYALQGAEGMLVQKPDQGGDGEATFTSSPGAGGDRDSDEEPKQISLYADQPMGMVAGLRGAYASLTRDLYLARDAVIAVPGEVMESQSAQGAARAVLRRAPTIIFRPAIGATKAIGQTLMGATNALDPMNRRRMEAKYKKH